MKVKFLSRLLDEDMESTEAEFKVGCYYCIEDYEEEFLDESLPKSEYILLAGEELYVRVDRSCVRFLNFTDQNVDDVIFYIRIYDMEII
jgi:hypothetical protein